MKTRSKEKRSEVIAVRLTPEEREQIEARARAVRIGAGSYVRQRFFALIADKQQPEALTA